MAGSGPNARAYDVASSAPVGVTSSFCDRSAVDRHTQRAAAPSPGPAPERRRARDCTVPPPTLSGDDTMSLDAEPLEREHGADDVDDRIERADLVQVDPLDRRAVDRGLRLRQPLEQPAPRDPGFAADSADRRIAATMCFR